ncbi:unnamed protein product [Polarella glacialis]|uniref:Uncharacterized protein n=1 Tax=Polarella glacialis TaxID=89957 RepID=A0A813J6I2_POLGL|nr:unnamed protein product [Polarella glacialis]
MSSKSITSRSSLLLPFQVKEGFGASAFAFHGQALPSPRGLIVGPTENSPLRLRQRCLSALLGQVNPRDHNSSAALQVDRRNPKSVGKALPVWVPAILQL